MNTENYEVDRTKYCFIKRTLIDTVSKMIILSS